MPVSPVSSELEILHLIYHRHKNQHSHLHWWKYFAIFHRKCKRIDTLYIDHYGKHKSSISQLCDYLIRKIIPKLYYSVQSELARDQFVTLYLMVIACVGKLRVELSQLVINQPKQQHKEPTISSLSTENVHPVPSKATTQLDDSIGQRVSREDLAKSKPDLRASEDTATNEPSVKKKKRAKDGDDSRPRKKKKKTSAIDDIFGF